MDVYDHKNIVFILNFNISNTSSVSILLNSDLVLACCILEGNLYEDAGGVKL